MTGSLYDSRYEGGDGTWRNTRYDQGLYINLLGGKELIWAEGTHILGINGRIVYMGGERYNPIDHPASQRSEELIFDHDNAFTQRFANRFITDLTLTYQINRNTHTSIWVLQVKNLLMEKDLSFDYNFQKNQVDIVKEGTLLPVLSYKIEF